LTKQSPAATEKGAGLKEILNNYFKGEIYENRITVKPESD
jgi:hypothetical protein